MRIEWIDRDTAAFVGPTRLGPIASPDVVPEVITSVAEFERIHGSPQSPAATAGAPPLPASVDCVAHAVSAFFAEGGRRACIARVADAVDPGQVPDVAPGAAAYVPAFAALAARNDIGLVATPGSAAWPDGDAIRDALIDHVATPGLHRLAILDTPPGLDVDELVSWRATFDSAHAAAYAPWLVITDPAAPPDAAGTVRELQVPPSGSLAGILARVERTKGSWRAPANEAIDGAIRAAREITASQQAVLNPVGINCLRRFAGRGLRVWGARTTTEDPDWRYVNVRRYVDQVVASITRGLDWVVFEPNDEPLWQRVRDAVERFLQDAWRSGALVGDRAERAFFVRCDRTTMTQDDLDSGRLVCTIGIAMIKPAEFVILRIGQWTADASRPDP